VNSRGGGAGGAPPHPDPPSHAPRVLVVDDFDDNRLLYAEFLAYSGFDVEQASDGAEAVARAHHFLPDVVVMDLALPVMDGWEATRRIKADPRTCRIPVVALTGHALARHLRVAREAGCDAFLAKPCLPERLLQTLREVMDRCARDRAAVSEVERSRRSGRGDVTPAHEKGHAGEDEEDHE
jgi:CheY-like chemotaxis protein